MDKYQEIVRVSTDLANTIFRRVIDDATREHCSGCDREANCRHKDEVKKKIFLALWKHQTRAN